MQLLYLFLGISAALGIGGLWKRGLRRVLLPCAGAALGLAVITGHLISGANAGGMLYALAFLAGGVWIVRCLLPEKQMLARVWLGLALGLLLMMWLPALGAFFVKFSLTAHWIALVLLALLGFAAWLFRGKKQPAPWREEDTKLARLLLLVALPLTLIGGYLQWTHTILPAADGSLHVGQSTYGDLPLHLAIASSLRNASFPADYNILPGELLTYPHRFPVHVLYAAGL